MRVRAESFDEHAELAAALCGTPRGSVRLADPEQRWLQADFGSPPIGAALESSLTNLVLTDASVVIISDVTSDPRLRAKAQVTGEQFIRFCAGAPLVTANGSVLGALCVFDTRPRTLSTSQLRHLQILARQVTVQVEWLTGIQDPQGSDAIPYFRLEESEQRWRALVEHSPVAVAVIAADGRFAYANPEALRLYGAKSADIIQGRIAADFSPVGERAGVAELFGAVISGDQTLHDPRWHLKQLGGEELTVEINATAVTYRGRPAVQVELRDISARAAADHALADSERRFRAVFTRSPVAMGISDETGSWVEANAALGELLGVESPHLLGRTVDKDAHPDDRALMAQGDRAHQAVADRNRQLEIRFVRPSGEIRWAWISTAPSPGPAGQNWTLLIAQDITTRQAAEHALQESESELAAIAAVARCVQAGQDPRPIVVASLLQMAGASSVAMLEQHGPDTLAVTASAGPDRLDLRVMVADTSMTAHVWRTGRPIFLADVDQDPRVDPALLAIGQTVSALWQPVIVDGRVEAVLTLTWQRRLSEAGHRAIRTAQVIADETAVSLQATRLRQELEHSALTDPLTGLLNRRAWDASLQRSVKEMSYSAGSLTIALIDIDHFKSYNDAHGHAAGDAVLRDFSDAGRKSLRTADVLARWGGEEFILSLPDTGPGQAAAILNRINDCLPAGLTCSIGYTLWRPGETAAECVARADAALYQAKAAGRNRLNIG